MEELTKKDDHCYRRSLFLVEIADGLAAVQFRKHAVAIINLLKKNPRLFNLFRINESWQRILTTEDTEVHRESFFPPFIPFSITISLIK